MKKLLIPVLLLAGLSGRLANAQDNDQKRYLNDALLQKVWETDAVLTTAESVLYDGGSNTLFVSNINGEPVAKDGNGFISMLDTTGKVRNLKWATGLNAPKGMAVMDGKLYVSDVDELVEISLNSGNISKRYPVKGATFLNDVATDGKRIVVSDSRTGKIHELKNGDMVMLKDGQAGINGLAFSSEGVLYSLDKTGVVEHGSGSTRIVNKVVTGGDGLIILKDNTFIVSRWQGEIYLVSNGMEKLLLDTKAQKSNTADIEYLSQTNLLLVPTFAKDRVVAYRLEF
ncbi:MAG TPA: hypothetical protein VGE26_03420 [Sphingobacteriaceae bacterium]